MTVGPQPIQRPSGAIDIQPGQSIQEAINVAPGGAAFYLRAGVHLIHGNAVPRSGNAFVGEFGAILDGSGWVTSDIDAAAFKAMNVDVDDVAIRNLEMRLMPQKAVMAYKDFSSGWTVDHCDIHLCKTGVELPGNSAVLHSKLHHCVGTPGHSNPAERGGGYAFNSVAGIRFEGNDVSENGTEQKWILCTGIMCKGNHFHHGAYAGPWIDGGGAGSIIEDNICEDHVGPGIVVEIASGVIVRRNTSRRSVKESGLLVSVSQGITVVENIFELNPFGIDLFLECERLAEHYPAHPDPDLANNLIQANTVIVGDGQLAVLFTHRGGCEAPYLANSKNNRFEGNRYTVPTPDGRFWTWGNGQNKTFAEWQALGFDTTSTSEPEPPEAPEQPSTPTCSLDGNAYAQGASADVTIRRNRVSAWTADHPEWHVVSTKPHPKNKSQVVLTVECRP